MSLSTCGVHEFWTQNLKEHSWTKLPSFLFGLNICVDFDLRDYKNGEYIDIHKTAKPNSWNPGFKTGFQNNTCLKFSALFRLKHKEEKLLIY